VAPVGRTNRWTALILAVSCVSCRETTITPAADDPIRPNGVARSRADIVRFMESEVMPFARRTLEPLVGVGNVRCETCHGADAASRGWRMPAVTALPQPGVLGMADSIGSDSQLRNALHGYVADADKQRVAAHMRSDVLPGMAALLRRPVYDFTQPYAYNAARGAFGCYHCHMATP
jgi:hypothetical protein